MARGAGSGALLEGEGSIERDEGECGGVARESG